MARAGFVVFALLAYAIFFATFLYLIAFVGGFPFVPTNVDTGMIAGKSVAIAIDLALIGLFGVQHSVMARPGFKAGWTRIVPEAIERSLYVLASSIVLIVLMAFWHPIGHPIWAVTNKSARMLIWALFAAGWGIVLLSTFLINHFELFGLAQVVRAWRGTTPGAPKLGRPLLYKLVRHPLYSGFLIAFWATPFMSAGHLLLALGMTAYILIAIRYEERDLVTVFGADYETYQREVGMVVPGIGRTG